MPFFKKTDNNNSKQLVSSTLFSPNTLLTTEEIIKLSKKGGVDFGPGNPSERIRYFIKLGILPHAVKKTSKKSHNPVGHLPTSCITKLIEIQRLSETGLTFPQIVKRLKVEEMNQLKAAQLKEPIANSVGTSSPANEASHVVVTVNQPQKDLQKHFEDKLKQQEKRLANLVNSRLETQAQIAVHLDRELNEPKKVRLNLAKGILATLLIFSLASGLFFIQTKGYLRLGSGKFELPADKNQVAEDLVKSGQVLAATSASHQLYIDANTEVSGTTLFKENITAPNIVYSVAGGTGITVSGGQNPTVSLNSKNLVSSVNDLTGTVTLQGSGSTTLSKSGSTITISSTSSSSGITSEADTLETVTGRGATTATAVSFTGGATVGTSLTLSPFSSNGGVLYTDAAGLTKQVTAGTSSQCLLGGTTPSFGSCATGSTGVTSLDLLTGALTINNSSGLGTAITIDDASTAAKGIASFSSSYFSTSSGAVSIKTGGVSSTEILDGTIAGGDLASNITISTTGNISTTSSGTITSASTLTASNGLTLTTGALNISSTSGSIAATLTTTNSATFSSSTANSDSLAIKPQSTTTTAPFTGTLTSLDLTGTHTWSFPNEDGTVCTTGSVCSGYQASGSFANTALSNLASVAINAALVPGTAGALDFGSTTKPWANIYLAGTSGTPATNQFEITGASTGGVRVITLPDASITVNAAADISGTTLASNVVTSSLTTVGALASGSIASGFGSIATANTISTSNNISTTGSGTITSAGLLTGSLGATISGATTSINASSNFDTNINTGSSTGTVTIGNSSSTAIKLGKFTTANGVLFVSDTAGTVAETAASTGSQCLTSASAGAAPAWGSCALGTTGVTSVVGTTNQITAFPTTGDVILSLPSAITTPGSLTTTTTLTATTDFTVNGNTTLGDTTADRLTVTAQILGASPLVFQGATDNSFTTTLAFTDPTTPSKVITFPNETGTVCTTGSVCSGYQASGSYLTSESDTLATVTGRGATTTTLVNLDGGIAVDTSNFTVSGTTGAIVTADDLAVNGGDITTTATTFNLLNTTATTINFGQAATTLSIGPTGATATTIDIAGGSGATGCTVAGATGNLTCSGNITSGATGTPTVGYWTRNTTSGYLYPATLTDNVGIGISSPTAQLHVVGGTDKGIILTSGNGSGGNSSDGSPGADINLTSGNGGAGDTGSAGGPGGNINLTGGTGGATGGAGDGSGGNIVIAGGNGVGGSSGGNVTIKGGSGATAGTIGIGTSNTSTVTIGNSTTATALNLTSGTGAQTHTSSVVSGTGTTSAFVFQDSALTTGTGVYGNFSALTSGKAVNITSASTAGTASGSDYLLYLDRSGANNNTAHNAYGIYSSVTNTNVTSGTNIAGYFSASGATTANYGLYVAAGTIHTPLTNSQVVTTDSGGNLTTTTATAANTCSDCLIQVPLTTGRNTITPTAASVVALTVNGTSSTAATALSVVQGGDASAQTITANAISSGNILSISSTSTAAASNTQTGLSIALSGTNGTSTQTTYGLRASNTHAGTASTNVGGLFTATGGTVDIGVQVAAMTGATSTGIDIGALSGATANYGLNIGAISGALGTGINIGAITSTGAANYGIFTGNVSGATNNYGIVASATTAAGNYALYTTAGNITSILGATDFVKIDNSTAISQNSTTSTASLYVNSKSLTSGNTGLSLNYTSTAILSATQYGLYSNFANSSIVSSINSASVINSLGIYSNVSKSGVDSCQNGVGCTGITDNTYGIYGIANTTGTVAETGGSVVRTTFGGYFSATGDTNGTTPTTYGTYSIGTSAATNYGSVAYGNTASTAASSSYGVYGASTSTGAISGASRSAIGVYGVGTAMNAVDAASTVSSAYGGLFKAVGEASGASSVGNSYGVYTTSNSLAANNYGVFSTLSTTSGYIGAVVGSYNGLSASSSGWTQQYGAYTNITDSSIGTLFGAGTWNYGVYTNVNVTGNVNAIKNAYGEYVSLTNNNTTTDQGTRNAYGIYSTVTGGTNGTNTTYAAYLSAVSGDTNYGLYVAAGISSLSGTSGEGLVGAGLSSCSNASTSKLLWSSSTNLFSCGVDQTAGGAAASVALSGITAATATNTIDSTTSGTSYGQIWQWSALTTNTGMTFSGGSAMTTGSVFALGTATYVHTALNDEGSLSTFTFTDASTNANNGGITNGLKILSTINTSGAGTKTINGLNVATPTVAACTTGACTFQGVNIGAISGAILGTGVNIGAISSTGATNYGLSIGALSGATTAKGISIGALSSATSTGIDIGAFTGATTNTGINITSFATATTSKGIVIGTNSSATAYGIDIGALSGATTNVGVKVGAISGTGTGTGIDIGAISSTGTSNYGINIAALTSVGTNSYGLNIGGLSGASSTLKYGVSVGAISGTTTSNYGLALSTLTGGSTNNVQIQTGAITDTGTTNIQLDLGTLTGSVGSSNNYGIRVGNIDSAGATSKNYGISLGTLGGGTTSNYQISTGTLTSATTTTNAQINLGGVVTTGGTTNYGINVGALSGTGTTNFGIAVQALTSVGTSDYGLHIGGLSGASTNNYGVNIGALSAGTAINYGINIAAITPAGTTTAASISTAGIAAGAGTATYGINLGTNASTATNNYGINIGALSGAGTNNYGVYIGSVTGGATTNYALYTSAGDVNLNSGNFAWTSSSSANSFKLTSTSNAAAAGILQITGSSLAATHYGINLNYTYTGGFADGVQYGMYESVTHTPTDNHTMYGNYITLADAANTSATTINDFGFAANISLTNNLATKNAYGIYGNVISTSTLADALYGAYFKTAANSNSARTTNYGSISYGQTTSTTADSVFGSYGATVSSGAATTGTQNAYGVYGSTLASGATNGATKTAVGVYGIGTATNATDGASTISNVYGGIFNAVGENAGSTMVGNTYGIYTTAATGDNNYGLYVAAGNVNVQGLTASLGVYTDVNKNLTSTPPTSGILGYWLRTSTTLTTANAADNVTVDGTFTANGPVNLGDATSDDITFTGYVASSIIPKTDDTYDLGDNTHRWQDLYLGPQTLHIGTSTADEASLSYTTATNTLLLDNTAAGIINIGTTALAQAVTVGNNTSTTSLAFNSGTGSQTFTSKVATGATTSSAFVFVDADLTTAGTGIYGNFSTTTGKGVDLNVASLTSGVGLSILGPTATGITGTSEAGSALAIGAGAINAGSPLALGSNGEAIYINAKKTAAGTSRGLLLNLQNASTSGSQATGVDINIADAAGFADTNVAFQASVTNSGAAAQFGYGSNVTVTSNTATTADTIYGSYIATASNRANTSGTKLSYGLYGDIQSNSGNGGLATNVGIYNSVTTDNDGAGSETTLSYGALFNVADTSTLTSNGKTLFGVYSLATGTNANGGSSTTYGGYFNGTGEAAGAGAGTAYGVYATAASADTNYGIFSSSANATNVFTNTAAVAVNGTVDINTTSATTNVRGLDNLFTGTSTGNMTQYGQYNSFVNAQNLADDNTSTYYAQYITAAKTGTDTAATTATVTSTYGIASIAANTSGTDDAEIARNTFAGYFSSTGNTNSVSTAYGIYATAASADKNYGLFSTVTTATGNYALYTTAGNIKNILGATDFVTIDNSTAISTNSTTATAALYINNTSATSGNVGLSLNYTSTLATTGTQYGIYNSLTDGTGANAGKALYGSYTTATNAAGDTTISIISDITVGSYSYAKDSSTTTGGTAERNVFGIVGQVDATATTTLSAGVWGLANGPASGSTVEILRGVLGSVTDGGNGQANTIYGIAGLATEDSTTSVGKAYGGYFGAGNGADNAAAILVGSVSHASVCACVTGTTNSYGGIFYVDAQSQTGDTSNAYGILVSGMLGGGGATNNSYGIYLANQTSVTSDYGIYIANQTGGSTDNYSLYGGTTIKFGVGNLTTNGAKGFDFESTSTDITNGAVSYGLYSLLQHNTSLGASTSIYNIASTASSTSNVADVRTNGTVKRFTIGAYGYASKSGADNNGTATALTEFTFGTYGLASDTSTDIGSQLATRGAYGNYGFVADAAAITSTRLGVQYVGAVGFVSKSGADNFTNASTENAYGFYGNATNTSTDIGSTAATRNVYGAFALATPATTKNSTGYGLYGSVVDPGAIIATGSTNKFYGMYADIQKSGADNYTTSGNQILVGGYANVANSSSEVNAAATRTNYGYYASVADSTATNTPAKSYGVYANVPTTGNAAKVSTGLFTNVSSTSTTGDSVYGTYATVAQSGAINGTTKTLIAAYGSATATNATNGASTISNTYGAIFSATGENGGATHVGNTYGIYANAATGDNVYGAWITGNTMVDLNNSNSSTEAVCGVSTSEGATNDVLDDCTTNVNADYAEIYATDNLDYGEIAIIGPDTITTQHNAVDQDKHVVSIGNYTMPKLIKSSAPYQAGVLGIISNNWSDFSSTGRSSVPDEYNPKPVALNGRVPVKVSTENGAISPGDPLTTSSTAGVAMRADLSKGSIIGKALGSYSGSEIGKVLMFVETSTRYNLAQALQNTDLQASSLTTGSGNTIIDALGNVTTAGNVTANGAISAAAGAFTVDGLTGNVITTGSLTAASLYITGDAVVSGQLSVSNIAAPIGQDIQLKLGDNLGATKFAVVDTNNNTLFKIDSKGNTSISGPNASLSIPQGYICVNDSGTCNVANPVNGTVYADNFSTTGTADLAEHFPTTDSTIGDGDIVTVDPNNKENVIKATKTYDDSLLGIISTAPGISLNSTQVNGKPLALAGRVPTKVNLENGPIKAGDPITSSSTAGVGMRATHAGRVIGIALENYDSSQCNNVTTQQCNNIASIVVFVNPSWFTGSALAQNGSIDSSVPSVPSATSVLGAKTNADGTLAKSVVASQLSDSQIKDLVDREVSDKIDSLIASGRLLPTSSQSSGVSSQLSAPVPTPDVITPTPEGTNSAQIESSASAESSTSASIRAGEQIAKATDESLQKLTDLLSAKDVHVDTLQVLGNSHLADTQVAGAFSQDGTFIIDYGRQLNVLGSALFLQNDGFAGNTEGLLVDIGNGAVRIDKTGNLIAGTLTAQNLVTKEITVDTSDANAKSVGSATINRGQTQATIFTTLVKPNAKILITPTGPTGGKSLYIANKSEYEGFTVALDGGTAGTSIQFDWLIVNSKAVSQAN